jgi:hypothetical protein
MILKKNKELYTELRNIIIVIIYIYYLGYKDEYPNQP